MQIHSVVLKCIELARQVACMVAMILPLCMGVISISHAADADPEAFPMLRPNGVNINSSGAASFSLPINVPPGRNGVWPTLALNYNSQAGEGWVGVGWSLDLGCIHRSTKRGVDFDGDVFVAMKDGSTSELVPRKNWNGAYVGDGYYGAKIESAFTMYHKLSSGGWIATTRDGMRFYYGTTDNSQQNDPQNAARVFKWCLDRVEDTNGNYMKVVYQKQAGDGEIYPYAINYTGHDRLPAANSVEFNLENQYETAVTTKYDKGFAVRAAYRLKTSSSWQRPVGK